jgi:PEGA domain
VLAATTCGDGACTVPPCPFPLALDVNVMSSGGAPVPGLSVTVSGPSGSVPCQSTGAAGCEVSGSGGTYHVTVSAPGFQSVQQTVQVASTGKYGCGTCELTNTQHLSITLAAGAPG